MEIRKTVKNGIVYRNVDSLFRYNAWPTVCRDDEGVLYTVYSGFRGAHICPFGKTCLCRSFDGGKTWTAPVVVNDTWLDDRDAGIVYLGKKTVMVSWFSHPVEAYLNRYHNSIWEPGRGMMDMLYPTVPESKNKGGSFIRVSEDGGLTWGETVKLPVSAPHGPILRRDGSVFYLGKEMYCHSPEQPDVIIAMESRDCGQTWQEIGRVPLPEIEGITWGSLHEPHAVELPDGRLLGAIRSEYNDFTVLLTSSEDGGRTWTVPKPTGILGSPPHLLLHSSGAVILTFGRRHPPYGERALVSRDGGATWPEEVIIRDDAPNGDLGYPATVELPDGKLLTVYYQIQPGDDMPSIQYSVWEL